MMINNCFLFLLEDIDSSIQWILDILNTKLFVYSGTTVTILSFILMGIKFFVPRNKQLRVLENEKKTHLEEIEKLNNEIELLRKEIDVLNTKVSVLIDANAYNAKVRHLKASNNTIDNNKKVKVKVINNAK